MLDVAQPLMAAAPRFVSALLSGFAAPAPHPTIRGFAAYFNAYGPYTLATRSSSRNSRMCGCSDFSRSPVGPQKITPPS